MDLNKLKQAIFNSRIQVVVFDDEGTIVLKELISMYL